MTKKKIIEDKLTKKLMKISSTLILRVDPLAIKIKNYLDIPSKKAINSLQGKKDIKYPLNFLLKDIENDILEYTTIAYEAGRKVMEDHLKEFELQEAEIASTINNFFKKGAKNLIKAITNKFKERVSQIIRLFKSEKDLKSNQKNVIQRIKNLNMTNNNIAFSLSRNAIMLGFNKAIDEESSSNIIYGVRFTSQLEMRTCLRCGMLDGTIYWKDQLL